MKNAVWCLKGMQLFGNQVKDITGWDLYVEAPIGDDIDLVYIVGMYDPPYYVRTLEMTAKAKRRLIHWCGTDVEVLRDNSKLPEAIHLCESEQLQRELFEKGVQAEVCTLPTNQHFELTPLPEKKQVTSYLGSDPDKYGANMLMALMDALPDVEFATYMYGHNDAEELAEICKETSVYLRLTAHDGSAQSAREYMEAGRPAVITADLPFSRRVKFDDLLSIMVEVKAALQITEHNMEMVEHYQWFNSRERYLADLYLKAGVEVG